MADLIVGCPVLRREWIIGPWIDAVDASCAKAGVVPTYAFVGDRRDPTFDVVSAIQLDRVAWLDHVDENVGQPFARNWTPDRHVRMVSLRNTLLGMVRREQPRLFFALDSDVLLHPDTISDLLAAGEGFDAIGAACYLTVDGLARPNCGWFAPGTFDMCRSVMAPLTTFRVDVLLAAVLMTPAAYAIDYEFHPQAEDVGWSAAATRAGLRLGWDNRHVNKHVFGPEMLDKVDERVGW